MPQLHGQNTNREQMPKQATSPENKPLTPNQEQAARKRAKGQTLKKIADDGQSVFQK